MVKASKNHEQRENFGSEMETFKKELKTKLKTHIRNTKMRIPMMSLNREDIG